MNQEYATVDDDRKEDETARSRHEVLRYHSLQRGRGRVRGKEGEWRGRVRGEEGEGRGRVRGDEARRVRGEGG